MEGRLATDDPVGALRKLGLCINGNFTNAAVILFGNNLEQQLSQCLLTLVRFKGTTKSKIIDSRRVFGHAFKLLAEAEDFVMRHMSIESEFIPGKMARNDIPDYSLRAVREAIVNAVCHRDYLIYNGNISLMVYDDRLEITSPGVLPRSITVDELKEPHTSYPRNRKLLSIMYRRGIVESVGMGTQLMIDECLAIGKPEPNYFERGNSFVVQFIAKTHAKDSVAEQVISLELSLR